MVLRLCRALAIATPGWIDGAFMSFPRACSHGATMATRGDTVKPRALGTRRERHRPQGTDCSAARRVRFGRKLRAACHVDVAPKVEVFN
jgi:hypothetical protein